MLGVLRKVCFAIFYSPQLTGLYGKIVLNRDYQKYVFIEYEKIFFFKSLEMLDHLMTKQIKIK